MITTICYVSAGFLMGWLARWKRDSFYFKAIKHELELMKKYISEITKSND
jgi:hypothetical protein